jgi:two-component system, sensor histidine kinase and response regulator
LNTRRRAARILLIEDDQVDRLAVRRALAKADFHPQLTEASDYASARHALLTTEVDCVLSDVYLPGGDGLDLLREARGAGLQIPIIILTGQGDEALAVELMKAGATDYLPKHILSPDALLQSMRRAFRIYDAELAAREAQEELKRLYVQAQQATAARDEVLAVVSHDLRNPLAVVKLNASLLREDLTKPDGLGGRNLAHLERIERATARIERLIADLLDAACVDAKALSVHPSPVRANALVAEAAEMGRALAEHKGCSFSVHPTEEALFVRADRERILQVFSNLIGNSLKVVAEDQGEISLSAERHGELVDFTVSDNGPGIPAEQVERLFERFWRGKESSGHGAGLGLYIARGIVEAHDGTIAVVETSGAGASIRFQLPVVSATT